VNLLRQCSRDIARELTPGQWKPGRSPAWFTFPMPDDLPIIAFADQDEFQAWMEAEHQDNPDGIWLKFAKKASGIDTIVYSEALDVALCFGWIDGQGKGLDETHHLQRFLPRRKRSKWSMINRDHVARLIEEGRMRPEGQAQIDAAKADGRWDAAYPSPANATVPDDLRTALDDDPKAAATFAGLSSANRYSILYHLHDAKKPETRERRMQKYLAMLREGKGPHDPR
jgi:uncharacterized protein YdeI (YjbR/CyaY-like superfamily)